MFGGIGMWELLIIFLILFILFGAKRLPELGKSLGKGIRDFKKTMKEIEEDIGVDEVNESIKDLKSDVNNVKNLKLDDVAKNEPGDSKEK